jgi:hypothetical protein
VAAQWGAVAALYVVAAFVIARWQFGYMRRRFPLTFESMWPVELVFSIVVGVVPLCWPAALFLFVFDSE